MSPGGPTAVSAPGIVPMIPEHELLRPIAAGAYGQVWLACNRLGAYRAVKIVHRASFDHERPFEREFAGIKAFEPISRSHEGFVNLLQVGRDDTAGYFYYVMELADALGSSKSDIRHPKETPDGKAEASAANGLTTCAACEAIDWEIYVPRTLAAELKSCGRFPLDECNRIGLSLANALAQLHGLGLVHRDIKPSNIIFVRGVPKLADVGLVTTASEARSFVGTEGFIAPEGPGTAQADLYSLGIVLYVISTGKSHQDFPEPPPDFTNQSNHAHWLEFNAVVHKACQTEARQRYQSAQEMQDELALLQRGQSVKGKRAAQRRWLAAKKLILGGLMLALGYLLLPFPRAKKVPHTPNSQAVSLYDLGKWHYEQCTPKDHATAFSNLTAAVQIDPHFPEPYMLLTALYGWSTVPGVDTDQQRLEGMKEIARKLKAINPNLAETHAALSLCHLLQRDWRQAEREIKQAIEVKPDAAFPHFLYCVYLGWEGRTADAEREGNRALALDPDPAAARVSSVAATWPLQAARRYDLAIARLRQLVELDPRFAWGHLSLGDCYEAQTNYVAALEEYRSYALLTGEKPGRVAEIFAALRQAYDTQGNQGYLRKWTEVILADEALPDDQQMFADRSGIGLAVYFARLGEKEKALKYFEEHFDEPNTWCQIKFSPLYDFLQDEPRYKALLKRAGLEK